jgi:integrase
VAPGGGKGEHRQTQRRSGSAYSASTLAGYRRSWTNCIAPAFGTRRAAEIDAVEWQPWIDGLSQSGLSRARIANHVAVASAIYSWAARPNRRLVPRNPLCDVELPANDEKPRTRVAPHDEARRLLAALRPEDRVPYALAFFAGLRRSEIARLEWGDVELDGYRLRVRKSKSEAGTNRRPPIAEPLRTVLLEEDLRQGRPGVGRVCRVSVTSGTLPDRAYGAWAAAGLVRITLHECRHTYASFLMAAGYTLKEIMEYMGHAICRWSSGTPSSCRSRTSTTPRIGSTHTCTRCRPKPASSGGHNGGHKWPLPSGLLRFLAATPRSAPE